MQKIEFEKHGHLSLDSITIVVEALYNNNYDKVSPSIRHHLSTCLICKQKVLESFEVFNEINKTKI